MSATLEKRFSVLERGTEAERRAVRQKRQDILACVQEFHRSYNKTLQEARQYFQRSMPPEVAAYLADDWETNPLTLEMLRILHQPNGPEVMMERILEHLAKADGLAPDDLLCLTLLDASLSLERKFNLIQLAHRRGLPCVLVSLHGKTALERAEESKRRRAELDRQSREELAGKGYSAEELKQIITKADALRAKFWETVEPEQLMDTDVCEVCGAANDVAAKVARRFSKFAVAEGFTPAQCERGQAILIAGTDQEARAILTA